MMDVMLGYQQRGAKAHKPFILVCFPKAKMNNAVWYRQPCALESDAYRLADVVARYDHDHARRSFHNWWWRVDEVKLMLQPEYKNKKIPVREFPPREDEEQVCTQQDIATSSAASDDLLQCAPNQRPQPQPTSELRQPLSAQPQPTSELPQLDDLNSLDFIDFYILYSNTFDDDLQTIADDTPEVPYAITPTPEVPCEITPTPEQPREGMG